MAAVAAVLLAAPGPVINYNKIMNKSLIIVITILIIVAGYWFTRQSNKAPSKPIKIVSADIYNQKPNNGEFLGEKGETLIMVDKQITIPIVAFEDNKIRYFNTELDGKKIYFMVVRDEKGTYRAAANACEVCFGAHKGFRQEGDFIVCNNCGNRFALDTLGVTKGGCNPGPISSDVKVKNSELVINSTELAQVANLF